MKVLKGFKLNGDGNIYVNNGEEKAGSGGVAILIRRGVCEKEQVIYDDGIGKSMALKK